VEFLPAQMNTGLKPTASMAYASHTFLSAKEKFATIAGPEFMLCVMT
jgi:hypothetical protein